MKLPRFEPTAAGALRAARIALALALSGLVLALPAGAAKPKPKKPPPEWHWEVLDVSGHGELDHTTAISDENAKATVVMTVDFETKEGAASSGSGVFHPVSGNGTAEAPELQVFRYIKWVVCCDSEGNEATCETRDEQPETEAGLVSFKGVNKFFVKAFWNFPHPSLVTHPFGRGCPPFVVTSQLFDDVHLREKLFNLVARSLLAKQAFALKLEGTTPIHQKLPNLTSDGTYTWSVLMAIQRTSK